MAAERALGFNVSSCYLAIQCSLILLKNIDAIEIGKNLSYKPTESLPKEQQYDFFRMGKGSLKWKGLEV